MRPQILVILVIALFSLSSMAESQCIVPEGKYTEIEAVLNQFVLNNGNPNWGDWCYDSGYNQQEVEACAQELKYWDEWLECTGLSK